MLTDINHYYLLFSLFYVFLFFFSCLAFGFFFFFFFSSRRRHTRCSRDWSSDVCSSDLASDGRICSHLKPSACCCNIQALTEHAPDQGAQRDRPDHHAEPPLARRAVRQIGRASCRERV